jgi:hypothetical protein
VDSNWAGCPLTSKSTDCVQVFVADCLVYSSAKTQAIISQSSGEAELMAIHRGACFGVYVSHVWAELTGVSPVIKLFSDSSAARAIATRRGPGRVRHLTVKQLFVQSLCNSGRLTLHKVPGEDNTADIGTKVLDRKRIDFLLGRMHIVRATPAPSSGRVSTAKGTTLMALLTATLTPALAKGQFTQEELGANHTFCEALPGEAGSAHLPF